MTQTAQGRRYQPTPLKPFWSSSSQKRSAGNTGNQATQVEFVIRPLDGATPQKVVRKRGVIALREAGYSLEEIALEIGSSRLTVFQFFMKTLSRNEKLRLAIPT